MSQPFIESSEGAKTLPGVSVSGFGPIQHQFSPYDWNGGTIVAIGGADYVVLAADKRLATGYNIKSRNIDRLFKISETTYIAAGGCHADVTAFYNNLKYRSTMYKFDNNEEMGSEAAAQLVSNTLYYKRFFPFYALPIVAGLDRDGVGYCAGYDAVGSYIRSKDNYTANGSAASIAMPVLDNLFGTSGVSSGAYPKPVEKTGKGVQKYVTYSLNETIQVVKDVFTTVSERDIMCGDAVDIIAITKDGVKHEVFPLKLD
mmetsp:Transcript_5385/g.6279  ORF Transcript_5385/g.6279 Transcript_5385/m.6279 type:complete len:258 (-) Transcript_5385:1645-2418(-)